MGTYQLIGMQVSPWTHRAVWALDFCGVPYRFEAYTPGLGEPLLRMRTRNFRRPVQVPILIADGRVISGSEQIARYAAQLVGDDRLGDFAAIAPWERLSELATSEGRDWAVRRTLASFGAQVEASDGVLPAFLAPHLTWIARRVFRNIGRKYADLGPPGSMHALLTQARAQLRGRSYLLERFSYADILVATSLQTVEPVTARGPASREAWSWPELAHEFADLLAWRRNLMAQHWPSFASFAPPPPSLLPA